MIAAKASLNAQIPSFADDGLNMCNFLFVKLAQVRGSTGDAQGGNGAAVGGGVAGVIVLIIVVVGVYIFLHKRAEKGLAINVECLFEST